MTPEKLRHYNLCLDNPIYLVGNIDKLPKNSLGIINGNFPWNGHQEGWLVLKSGSDTQLISRIFFGVTRLGDVPKVSGKEALKIDFPIWAMFDNVESYENLISSYGFQLGGRILQKIHHVFYKIAMTELDAFSAYDVKSLIYELDEPEDVQLEHTIGDDKIESFKRAAIAFEQLKLLDTIPEGKPGAQKFEQWCLELVKLLFSDSLYNIALHPNLESTERRDIIATNKPKTDFWKRVLSDLNSRMICFEIKNYSDVRIDEYRQVLSYICEEPYGRVGFIINRQKEIELSSASARTFRTIYRKEGNKMILELTLGFIEVLLSDLCFRPNLDEVDEKIENLLDKYYRQYKYEPNT